jgi:hypothetical protein
LHVLQRPVISNVRGAGISISAVNEGERVRRVAPSQKGLRRLMSIHKVRMPLIHLSTSLLIASRAVASTSRAERTVEAESSVAAAVKARVRTRKAKGKEKAKAPETEDQLESDLEEGAADLPELTEREQELEAMRRMVRRNNAEIRALRVMNRALVTEIKKLE